ncbi:MAG: magnesium transporter CorA family protein [Mycobacteriales bacterium]
MDAVANTQDDAPGITAASRDLHIRAWREGRQLADAPKIGEVRERAAHGDVIWIDVPDPASGALAEIARQMRLSPLLVEDAVSHHERAKAVIEENYLFLNCYSVHYDAEKAEITTYEISAFATKSILLTVRVSAWEYADELALRWQNSPSQCRCGAVGLLHVLLDTVVDGHSEAVEVLDDQTDTFADAIFDDRPLTHDEHIRIFRIRRALVRLRRVAMPMREVLNTLTRRDSDLVPDPLQPYLHDVYDHVLRVSEQAESLRDTVTDLFETNLSLQDQRMNTIMKKLTSWAAIIAVPTAITGYFGQNVPYPGFGHELGFVLSLVLIVLIAVILYLLFRRKDWL